jgi:hypothetical protein
VGSIIKFGKLGKVFKDGESELLTGIARLVVLYEDLGLEMNEFRKIYFSGIESGSETIDYRTTYYLRRSLSTLVEFRSALTTIRATNEFKQAEAKLTKMDADYILEADQYLQKHGEQLKEMRNRYGGHVKLEAVKMGLEKGRELIGKVVWNRSVDDGWSMGLECGFAADIVVGAIFSTIEGDDQLAQFCASVEIMADGFNHARAATLALVHAFMWDRFGL